ncbi:lamin tail domain-containing protein [Algoriphagus sp. CAU 1675]|uniref:lamin tail domain-containing protein n=1 Tax=Algoriphagus sp. CAU 1675 TaxID=3032597 RepID=UPI0023DC5AD7|nr:lamin tail domain-containing protein [Algoriphagus sp. CAU 1675]MDF2158806.1 lamin tail domain-containing protein [Algoriphagus sp. CAU 1675]
MLYFFLGLAQIAVGQNYRQDFESDFEILSYPEEFLPGWKGNQVRSTSSRIFQLNSQGKDGSRALAVQPISTFDGELFVSLNPSDFQNPKLVFWAKTFQNGTGNRPALVYYSWAESLEGTFTEAVLLGSESEFPNENGEYKKFEIPVPSSFQSSESLFFKLEIRYGPGSGTCARWIMDDFEFGEFEEDLVLPQVSWVRGFDAMEVELQFTEAIDPVFSQIQLNYKLDGMEPEQAILKSGSLVLLRFGEMLVTGKSYQLEVKQIPDLAGNFLKDTILNFEFSDPSLIPAKALVINELMPSPRAENPLPNVEYIELFHTGAYPFRLEGLNLSNSRSGTLLGDRWLNPGEFLILAPESQIGLLEEFGAVLGLSSWPTLLNSGDEVLLRDDQGKLIDRLNYTTSSWGSSELSGGGYSLEVVNPYFSCDQSGLLKASFDPNRGTPGRQNSIFDDTPDLKGPELLAYRFLSDTLMILDFSEPISQDISLENFTFSIEVGLDSVQVLQSQAQLYFTIPFSENELVLLQLSDLSDCSGNLLEQDDPFEIIRPTVARSGEILINELLFNPRSGSPKFVELYNPTEKHLEIGDWALANRNEMGFPDQIRKLSDKGLVLAPGQYLVITTDGGRLQLEYPKSSSANFHILPSLPSYPIAGGTVVLLDSDTQISESFAYSEDLHHPLLRDPKGVSLERISTETSADIPSNWHSASGVEEYATPGRKNSQLIPGEFEGELIQIDPGIFDPEGSNGNTFAAIRYQLGQNGWVGSFRIYDLGGRLVQALAQNEILGTEGFFTWTGTDGAGKKVRPGYYILLVELYNLDGELRTIKKTIVVAERL